MALSISDFETIAQLILAVQPDVDEDDVDRQLKKIKRDQEAKLKRDPLKIPAEVDPKRGGRGGGPGRSTGGAALLGGGFAGGLSSGFVTRPLAQGQGLSSAQMLRGGAGLGLMRVGGPAAAAGAGLIIAAGATKEYLQLASDGIMAFSALEEQTAANVQVYGEQASRKIQDFAKTTAEAYGITETAAIDATNGLGLWGEKMGFTKDETADFATQMVEYAADLAAFNDVPIEQALQAIQSAFAGQTKPLLALKIDTTDASKLEAFESRGIEGKSKGNLNVKDKKLGTLYAIEDQIGAQLGQAEREKYNTATQLRRFEGLGEELMVYLGRGIKQGFDGTFNTTFEELIQMFASLGEKIEDIGEIMGESLKPVFERLPEVAENLMPAIEGFAQKAAPILSSFADFFLSAIEDLLPPFMDFILGLMSLFDTIMQSPITGWLIKISGIAMRLTGLLFNAISAFIELTSVVLSDQNLKTAIDGWLDSLSRLVAALSNFVATLIPAFREELGAADSAIFSTGSSIDRLSGFLNTSSSYLDGWSTALEKAAGVASFASGAIKTFTQIGLVFVKAFALQIETISYVLQNAIATMWNGFLTVIQNVIKSVFGLVSDIYNTAPGVFDNVSPEIGNFMDFIESGTGLDNWKIEPDWSLDGFNDILNWDPFAGGGPGSPVEDFVVKPSDEEFYQLNKRGGGEGDPDPTGGMGSGSGGGGRGGGDVYINVLVEANAIADSTTIRKAVNQALKEGAVDLRRLQGAAA